MARRPLIAGNWKMNESIGEAVVLTQEISNHFEPEWSETVDVVLCPPYLDIKPSLTVLEFDRRKIKVGAQNVYYKPDGPYTGEISVSMLKDAGCTYCIVGHSERRELFGETNEDVNLKTKALLAEGLHPIICVGEPLHLRENGTFVEYVTAQVAAAVAGLVDMEVREIVIAYEPIWAIGTGRTATPEQAQEMCAAIRTTIAGLYTDETAQEIRVLYGGSLNDANSEMMLAGEDVDGGLVGSASLDAKGFVNIIESVL